MGSLMHDGPRRMAPATRITMSWSTQGCYGRHEGPEHIREAMKAIVSKIADTPITLTFTIDLPNGAPPLFATKSTTVGKVEEDTESTLAALESVFLSIDEGV